MPEISKPHKNKDSIHATRLFNGQEQGTFQHFLPKIVNSVIQKLINRYKSINGPIFGTFLLNFRIRMWMNFFNLFVALILTYGSHAQLQGLWQGIRYTSGFPKSEGQVFYLNISDKNSAEQFSRTELPNSEYFVLKNINIKSESTKISIKETVITQQKKSSKTKWCLAEGTLTYDSINGYLQGTLTGYNCRNSFEKVILYKSSIDVHQADDIELSHIWFDPFIKDYDNGLEAPLIRKKMRDNFKFEPIFFDYDQADIRPEFEAFLERVIHVVKGHSDLRVKVTGHTDSDGSDEYNMDLSKRRAQAIIDFFEEHGLSEERLEFDFKGERSPVDTNNTPEGRQRNRRVDFTFI